MKIKMLFLALILLNLSDFSLAENCSIVNNSEIFAETGKYVCLLYICVPNNIIHKNNNISEPCWKENDVVLFSK